MTTNTRIHVGLAVHDLDKSRSFYDALLGQSPVKVRDGYAKYSSSNPAVNLSLNQSEGDTRPVNRTSHFGVEVPSSKAVGEARKRLADAGLDLLDEEGVTCCYSVQDKVWAVDPDGNRWEFFVVLEDSDVHSAPGKTRASHAQAEPEGPCCEPTCCGRSAHA